MIIKVLGENWKVYFKKRVVFEGVKVAGLCDYSTKRIDVSLEYPKDVSLADKTLDISDTFYHEILHAIFREAGLVDQDFWDTNIEHMIIAPIAKTLAKNFPLRTENFK